MKKYNAINWKDGMKIKGEHFRQQRRYFLSELAASNRKFLNDNRFGVDGHSTADYPSYSLRDNKIYLNHLKAVTRSGHTIDVNNANKEYTPLLDLSEYLAKTNDGSVLQIYAKIDHEKEIEQGEIDPEEYPLRMPYVNSAITLEAMDLQHALNIKNLDVYLPIAQIKKQNHIFLEVNDYVPPVLKTSAHIKTAEWWNKFATYNFQIAGQNNQTSQRFSSNGSTDITSKNIALLSREIAFFFADKLDKFIYKLPDESPLEMFLFYKEFNRMFNAVLANMQRQQSMLKIFADWTSSSTNDFIEKIENINNLEYDHLDIHSAFKKINAFIEMMSTLFERISTLNTSQIEHVS